MKNQEGTGGYVIAAALLIAVGILLFLLVCSLIRPKVVAKHCNEFDSYAEIMDSYKGGNRGLDGDNDGTPCENRK